MILPTDIEKIVSLDSLAVENVQKYPKKRFIYDDIKKHISEKVFIGLAGLRGSGKTILLRQLRAELPNSIYVSLDTLPKGMNLFELTKELIEQYKIKYILIDEIHNYVGWQAEIKKIFDFLDAKIIFTSSSAIEIIQSKYDLSRRILVISINSFSFREYLFFKKNIFKEKIALDKLIANYNEMYEQLYLFESEFYEFCKQGVLPACLEAPAHQTINNIIEKIINQDLLIFRKLNQEDLANIYTILRFVSKASVGGCNYSSIAKNAGISKYKAQEYLKLLNYTFLIKIILPYGSNVLREPKILYALPFRSNIAEGIETEKLIGALREEFFVHHLQGIQMNLNYLKSKRGEKLPDYIVFYQNKKYVFEIGGIGKTQKQFKGVNVKEKFIVSQPGNPKNKSIPLILFGFLE